MKKFTTRLTLGLSLISSLTLADNHALVVGCCSKYNPFKNMKPLYGTENDAQSFKDILISGNNVSPKNLTYLVGEKATKRAIIDSLKSFLDDKSLKRGDTLYLYYSGHGSSPLDSGFFGKKIKSNSELKRFITDSTALIPYDVDKNNLLNTIIITKRDFKPIFEKLDKRGVKIIWITDACYAGNAYRSGDRSRDKNAPFHYHASPKKSNSVNYNHFLFYGASLASLPTQEHKHNGKMRGDFSFELENCLKKPTKSGYIYHRELKKCLNSNFANTQIQRNYYPLDSKLDNEVIMRVSKKMSKQERVKEHLFKLQNNQPLLNVTIKSLDSDNRVIKSFCNHERLAVNIESNTLKYILAFTKDREGKVIMIQPDSKNPMVGNRLFETEVQPPFGTDKIKIFATDDEKIYQTALKFSKKPNGILSTGDIREIYQSIKKSGNFRTANLTVETISRDVQECKKGD